MVTAESLFQSVLTPSREPGSAIFGKGTALESQSGPSFGAQLHLLMGSVPLSGQSQHTASGAAAPPVFTPSFDPNAEQAQPASPSIAHGRPENAASFAVNVQSPGDAAVTVEPSSFPDTPTAHAVSTASWGASYPAVSEPDTETPLTDGVSDDPGTVLYAASLATNFENPGGGAVTVEPPVLPDTSTPKQDVNKDKTQPETGITPEALTGARPGESLAGTSILQPEAQIVHGPAHGGEKTQEKVSETRSGPGVPALPEPMNVASAASESASAPSGADPVVPGVERVQQTSSGAFSRDRSSSESSGHAPATPELFRPHAASSGTTEIFAVPDHTGENRPYAPPAPVPASIAYRPVWSEPSVPDQVIRQIQFVVDRGHSETTIQLHPENLGAMRISLVVEDQTVTARITVEHDETRKLIEASLPQLKQSLADSGLQASRIEVDARGTFDPPPQQRHGGTRRASVRLSSTPSLEESAAGNTRYPGLRTFGDHRIDVIV
jgi:flagellar hook-length control protein FliK